MEKKRAIVSVIGKDRVGIISKITTVLAEHNMNILDISQTILQDFFTMIMIIDTTGVDNLSSLADKLAEVGKEIGVEVNIQREEIFQAMHRI